MPKSIQSRDNERVKFARKLADSARLRSEKGLFFAEGARLCADLAQRLAVHSLYVTEAALAQRPAWEDATVPVYVVSEPVAQKLAGTKASQGVFGLFHMPQVSFADMNIRKGVLVCEAVQDPANVGAMLRSAAGLGFGGVLLVEGCADVYGEKALRASMGAVGRIPLRQGVTLDEAAAWLRGQGARLVATALGKDATPFGAWTPAAAMALLVGNEGAGLSEDAMEAADEQVYIPMHNGVESLNAAVAAAVLMAYVKQKQSE